MLYETPVIWDKLFSLDLFIGYSKKYYVTYIYSKRSMAWTPDNTNSSYIEQKPAPLSLIKPYKNSLSFPPEGSYYWASECLNF